MDLPEVLSYVMDNLSTILPSATGIAGVLMSMIFMRKKTSVEISTAEFEKIKAGHLKEAADELLDSGKMTYTEYYKMNNFLDIAQKADEFQQEKQSAEQERPYDFDWFMRFYEITGTVSDDEMQILWAKILAGEIARPGSFSLRTLETLRNLSKEEAILYQNICSHSIKLGNRVILPNYEDFMENAKISFDDILKMEDCGLMNSGALLLLNIPLDEEWKILSVNNNFVFLAKVKSGVNKNSIEIKQYPFTVNGVELWKMISGETQTEDLFVFANALLKNYQNLFDFSMNHLTWTNGVEYKFNTKNVLEKNSVDN